MKAEEKSVAAQPPPARGEPVGWAEPAMLEFLRVHRNNVEKSGPVCNLYAREHDDTPTEKRVPLYTHPQRDDHPAEGLLRRRAQELRDSIADTKLHGDGAHNDDCPVCQAIAELDAALEVADAATKSEGTR